MRKILLSAALLASVVVPFAAARAEDQAYSFATVLHTYWKLSPPKSYVRFVESYAVEFPDLAGSGDKDSQAETIAENVAEIDLDDPITVTTNVQVNQYMPVQQAYVFAPFNANIYIPATGYNTGNLPTPDIFFTNGPGLKSLPLSPEDAAKFQSASAATYSATIRFLPKKATPLDQRLKGQMLDMTLRSAGRDQVVLKFNEDDGSLKSAEYVGDKAPENVQPAKTAE